MTNQHEPDAALATTEAPHQWRNLYMTSIGKTYWSEWLHPTEAACRSSSALWFEEFRAYIADGGTELVDTWSGDKVPFEAFLFAIPMPWQDEPKSSSYQ